MATPTKKQQQADKKTESAASKALKLVKQVSGEQVNRQSIPKGLNIDEVNSILQRGAPKKKDLDKAIDLSFQIYDFVDTVEASSKKPLYALLVWIKRNCMEMLEPEYQKSFARLLMEKMGRNRSTAFKDAKLVDFIMEWNLEYTLETDEIKDVLFKMRELSYKDLDVQKELVPKLETVTREQIAEHNKKERSKWEDLKTLPARYRKNKDGHLNVHVKDPELIDDLIWILKHANRKKLKELKEFLK